MPGNTDWLYTSLKDKLRKRYDTLEHYRKKREDAKKLPYYSKELGRSEDGTSTREHPYDYTLVHIEPTFEQRLYLPASWVHTQYDSQWWIVAQHSKYSYALCQLFVRHDERPEELRRIDPVPKICIELSDRRTEYPLVLSPPRNWGRLPYLKIEDIEMKSRAAEAISNLRERHKIPDHGKESKPIVEPKELRISSSNSLNGPWALRATVRHFQFLGSWPEEGHSSSDEVEKKSLQKAIEFLHAVDKWHRSVPETPIVIVGEEDLQINESALMAALSILRTCNFTRKDMFEKPKLTKHCSTSHEAKNNFSRQLRQKESPLVKEWSKSGTGAKDMVLQEVNNIYEQCSWSRLTENKLRLVYRMLAHEHQKVVQGKSDLKEEKKIKNKVKAP